MFAGERRISNNTRPPVTVPYSYGDSANAIDLFWMRSVHRSASQLTAFGRDMQNYYAPRAAIGKSNRAAGSPRYIQLVRQTRSLCWRRTQQKAFRTAIGSRWVKLEQEASISVSRTM